jgi:hypothetical protein
MEVVCWLALASAIAFAFVQLWDLWNSLHGQQHVGTSIGVSVTTDGPRPTERMMHSASIGGSTITTVSLFSTLCGIVAVWNARSFFGRLARGDVFTRGTLNSLRIFAIATLLMQLQPVVAAVVYAASITGFHMTFASTAAALVSTLAQPGSAPNIILLGLLVAMVAVLGRANQVAEDHAAIV